MCGEVTSDEYGLANQMISCDFSWASVCGFFHIILTPYSVSEILTFVFFFFFRSNRFDTVKVRLQTSKDGHFKGPLDCVLRTVRVEGVSGLYKGATPPLVGWMVMDSV